MASTPPTSARGNGGAAYRPTLQVSTRDLGEAVEVQVRDNGTGIAPEIRDQLFQPFFTTKPTGEGTGLGLSITWDIVTQQHGGSIEVDSEPGEFTEFTIRLPRNGQAPGSSTYVMHFANSGDAALNLLSNGIEPTLIVILSDINMPEMDGLDLLAEIKQRWADLPVMMVTAYGDDQRRCRARELGASEFLTKPVDFDLLKARLAQLPRVA